jgi:hypothetical protein
MRVGRRIFERLKERRRIMNAGVSDLAADSEESAAHAVYTGRPAVRSSPKRHWGG